MLSLVISPSESKKHSRELKCSLCEVIVDEVEAGIVRTSNKHNVQSRFRIEEKKYIPYARTEYRILEILEDEIPNHLAGYGIVRGSKWRVAKPTPPPASTTIPPPPPPSTEEGESSGTEDASAAASTSTTTPAPPQPDVEVSEKNTKKLKAVYEELLFGHTDEITLLFHRDEENIKRKMCIDLIKACPSTYKFTETPVTIGENAAAAETSAGNTLKEEL